jgi:Glyoxalase-like domain
MGTVHLGRCETRKVIAVLDHIVYAVRDLEAAVDHLEETFGTRPTPGGRHEGLGTHNALVDLGDRGYLEVIGPDPAQPAPPHPRPFGIDSLTGPRIVTWCIAPNDFDQTIANARSAGYDPGAVVPLTRRLPDGTTLQWRLATHYGKPLPGDGLVPFLIDWGITSHPSAAAAKGVRLTRLAGEHPDPGRVLEMLAALGVDLEIHKAESAALVATLDTPAGVVELR